MNTRESCRICGSSMKDVLSLGDIVPVDFIKPGDPVRAAEPLVVAECDQCGLVQLRHEFDVDSLFRQYWYLSSVNPTMVAALQDVVDSVQKRVTLEPGDVVIDIGANDGTLLKLYDGSVCKVGVDPAQNLAASAYAACDIFVNDYFEASLVVLPPAKVITSIAMFYDLNEPGKFVRKIADVLRRDGIWVMQMTDLVRMLRANAFDSICHEHVCYYSLAIFRNLVAEYDLEVFDVEFNDTNGASIRVYVDWRGARAVDPSVERALIDEAEYLADSAMVRFCERVQNAKTKVVDFVRSEIAKGKTFHAMGASTKGNTLLQYFGLGREEISVAAEVSPAKFGLLMAGSNVPIIRQQDSLAQRPDYYLVLPWHFIDFLVTKNEDYLMSGGALVVPLPEPTQFTLEPIERGGYVTVERQLGPTHVGDL